jgi:hypothetical protein
MRPFIHDQYAPLSHKIALGDGTRRPGAPTWVPDDDARRLAAYRILAAYRDNIARYFLPESMWELTAEQITAGARPPAEKYREYGHAGRVVVAARTSLMGDEQTLHAPAAAKDSQADTATREAAQAALDWLRVWAEKERLWLKMAVTENDAVSVGDGVYTLGWSSTLGRPKLRRYDPGFYFPALDEGDEDEYPSRVHLAWEQDDGTGRPQLHRMTWSLGQIRPALDPDREFGEVRYAYTDDGRPVPQTGDRLDSDGYTLLRTYAWDPEPSRVTCHFSYGVWDLSKTKNGLYDLDASAAQWQISDAGEIQRERDLRLDFVPVVHLPNTPAGAEHFGQSILLLLAQLLDDLSMTDTDLAESGALVGNATLLTKGPTPVEIPAGPGSTVNVPIGGGAQYLDTSKNLDALLKLLEELKDTLSENSRVSKVSLGRVNAGDASSGLALALSFSPEQGLVRDLRSVRDEKYPLLLKMAMRMAQGAEVLKDGPTPVVKVQFGSFMPSDKQQAIEAVARGMESGAMSTHTAVLTLQQADFPIEDAEKEVTRIRRDQAEQIATLLDLGPEGEALIWKLLGLKAPAELPEPPAAADDSRGGAGS